MSLEWQERREEAGGGLSARLAWKRRPERLPGRVLERVDEGFYETFVEKPYEGLFSRSRSRNHLFSGKKVDSGSLSREKYRVR